MNEIITIRYKYYLKVYVTKESDINNIMTNCVALDNLIKECYKYVNHLISFHEILKDNKNYLYNNDGTIIGYCKFRQLELKKRNNRRKRRILKIL
jgi:hypothetical protein